MSRKDLRPSTDRRKFLGSIAAGATTLGVASLVAPLAGQAKEISGFYMDPDPADVWFNKVKGKHKVVFDATRPHDVMPFAWPKVFLMTNEFTGTKNDECGVVVVLRHDAIPYAFEDKVWDKYKFGELFEAEDPKTKKPSTRNPFLNTQKGDFVFPGLGEVDLSIPTLQKQGVMFCVCNAAMTLYSAAVASKMNEDAAAVKKDWEAGLIPGIQPVPSGVWALGRAQEKGCAYIFAG